MSNLKHLGLFGNKIGWKEEDVNKALNESIQILSTKCPKLEELYIEENPICKTQEQENLIAEGLKTLKIINGRVIHSN